MNAVANEIDFNEMTRGIIHNRKKYRAGSFVRAAEILDALHELGLPPGYVESIRSDVFKVLKDGHAYAPSNVYLAFFGLDNKATHLKIGVAKDVKKRMGGIRTGNPLPNLWTYSATYETRRDAFAVESAILAHMAADSVHGEWVSVGSISERAAEAIVESLADVAEAAAGCRIKFRLNGVNP